MAAESRDTAARLPRPNFIAGGHAEVRLAKSRPRLQYIPPNRVTAPPLSDIWRPDGYVLVSEGVEIMGRADFGNDWTGEELKARQYASRIPEPHIVFLPDEDGVRRVPGTLPERWQVQTADGRRVIFRSEQEARERWREERPKLLEMWRAEHAARKRFDAVVSRIRTELYGGNLHAFAHRQRVGDLVEIPAYVWGRNQIRAVFELGDIDSKWRHPNVITFSAEIGGYGSHVSVEGTALISEQELQALLGEKSEQASELESEPDSREGQTPNADEEWLRRESLELKRIINLAGGEPISIWPPPDPFWRGIFRDLKDSIDRGDLAAATRIPRRFDSVRLTDLWPFVVDRDARWQPLRDFCQRWAARRGEVLPDGREEHTPLKVSPEKPESGERNKAVASPQAVPGVTKKSSQKREAREQTWPQVAHDSGSGIQENRLAVRPGPVSCTTEKEAPHISIFSRAIIWTDTQERPQPKPGPVEPQNKEGTSENKYYHAPCINQ